MVPLEHCASEIVTMTTRGYIFHVSNSAFFDYYMHSENLASNLDSNVWPAWVALTSTDNILIKNLWARFHKQDGRNIAEYKATRLPHGGPTKQTKTTAST